MIDNIALVDRMLKHQTARYQTPNNSLEPDWDVSTTIAMLCTEYHLDLDISWIKSHQDTKNNAAPLSYRAHLNIEANKLAGKYQEQYRQQQIYGPMLPAAHIEVRLNNIPIYGNYKTRIREAYSLPPLL